MPEATQLCTFVVGDLLLALEVRQVKEVLRAQAMTGVPRAHPTIRGLINLRGQIVMALDVRHRFGRPPLPPGQESMNVVVRTRSGPVSLLVDSIGDVVDVDGLAGQPPPGTLPPATAELVRGVHTVDDRLLLLLDLDRLVCLPAPHAALEPVSGGVR